MYYYLFTMSCNCCTSLLLPSEPTVQHGVFCTLCLIMRDCQTMTKTNATTATTTTTIEADADVESESDSM